MHCRGEILPWNGPQPRFLLHFVSWKAINTHFGAIVIVSAAPGNTASTHASRSCPRCDTAGVQRRIPGTLSIRRLPHVHTPQKEQDRQTRASNEILHEQHIERQRQRLAAHGKIVPARTCPYEHASRNKLTTATTVPVRPCRLEPVERSDT